MKKELWTIDKLFLLLVNLQVDNRIFNSLLKSLEINGEEFISKLNYIKIPMLVWLHLLTKYMMHLIKHLPKYDNC